MPKTLKIDQSIFQNLVTFYSETFNLPPLAAKIYAYLLFDFEKKGISFDEFVEIFCASKSSVSSNISILFTMQLIQDFNKINERKRYFVVNDNFLKLRYTQIIERLSKEIEILDSIQEFRGQTDDKYMVYKELMTTNINNIKNSLSKL
ncbi:transcriptional regulator [Chryseobacterium sp. cx-311]|uniref:transcriptional regulator n=1 Tax=Marnyiella aurantia TaxID=2758037 RepID=UPI001AE4A31B|nr:transcriptional regulator [Marnyiella aurantia]MBP0613087.1 transcriptional regulator [Marnyiella aurantia]